MAGKPKAQKLLHKTKTAAPQKGGNALAKLLNSCNQQVNYGSDFRDASA